MVGGTRIHRQIHERALVEMEEREEFLLGEENTSPAARTLFVSLDRADAIIEGAPDVAFTSGSFLYLFSGVRRFSETTGDSISPTISNSPAMNPKTSPFPEPTGATCTTGAPRL